MPARGAALLDPSLAERTSAIRTPSFLTNTEIAIIHAAAAEHKKTHGENSNVDTPGKLYLQDGGVPPVLVPIVKKIAALVTKIDREKWGILDDEELVDEGPLCARCVEYHEYWERGRTLCGAHHDAGSLFTADVLLCNRSEFDGGDLLTSEIGADGSTRMVPQQFERGDCLVFLSHKTHAVEPLRSGKRSVFVIEFWQECECVGNHRCMGRPPCLPERQSFDTSEVAAAAAEVTAAAAAARWATFSASERHNSSKLELWRRSLDCLRSPPQASMAVEAIDKAEEEAACATRERPAIMLGGSDGDRLISTWRGKERWASAESLNSHYGDLLFELAGDVKQLPLRSYIEYAHENRSDCPFYLVARSFEAERAQLLEDYSVPTPFADDCLGLIPGSKLARYWFVGGARSGTYLHVDPLCTSAWNLCTCGSKRWVFLPADTDIAALGLETYVHGRADQLPAQWFLETLPRLRTAAFEGKCTLLECVQLAGDCVYVPAGWYHAVVNIDPLTIAISQNLHHASALPTLWPRLSSTHHVYAQVLRDVLRSERPDVEATLPSLNSPEDTAAAAAAASQGDGQTVTCELPIFWRRCCALNGSKKPLSDEQKRWAEQQAVLTRPTSYMTRTGVRMPPRDSAFRASSSSSADESSTAFAAPASQPTYSASVSSILYVEAGWLHDWQCAKPSVADCIRCGSAASLFTAYERLRALVRAARERNALVVIVADEIVGSGAAGAAAAGAAELQRWLRDYELHLEPGTAILQRDTMDKWAAERGAIEWACLRRDERATEVARASADFPTHSLVEARISEDALPGISLHCIQEVKAGDRLLSIPLSACVTVRGDLVAKPGTTAAVEEDTKRLAATLMLLHRNGDPRAKYFEKVAPFERLARTLMVCWEEESEGGKRLGSNCVPWMRARARRKAYERTAESFKMDFDQYLWARCVVDTRSLLIKDDESGHRILAPIVDLANHRSLGATARLELKCDLSRLDKGGCVDLIANYAMSAGDEVTLNYDEDADFVDIFERYGFFDASAVVHTAEVIVPDEALPPMEGDVMAELFAEQASIGSDQEGGPWVTPLKGPPAWPSFNAWWVPDFKADECPLFRAITIRVGSAAARATLFKLLRAHLARYASTLEEDEAVLSEGDGGRRRLDADEDAALRLLVFEKKLIKSTLELKEEVPEVA